METRLGKTLGRYEIVAELGRGAMGAVYKARDPRIDRLVAIKTIALLNQDGDQQREFRQRFFVEAQAAGRLLHPGIVAIFDVGEEPQTHDPYIVMEYVQGQSLQQLLAGENKKLPLNVALRIAEELAEALDCAHAQGVIHRDLKPVNVLVTEDGHAKIADFGIAKLNLADVTLPGQVLGTPAYMSPEQLEGKPLDGRSDLFSLGVILYRMITGYGPFQGSSVTTVCFKLVNREPVPASTLNTELPPEVDALLSRAMAKDPRQRYQRGAELAMDLRELRRRSLGEHAPVVPPQDADATARSSQAPHAASVGLAPQTRGLPVPLQEAAHALALWSRTPWMRAGLLVSAAMVLSFSISYSWRGSTEKSPVPTSNPTSNAPAGPAAAPTPAPPPKKKPRVTPAPKPVADSTLQMHVEHRFAQAELALWIDGKLAYLQPLRGQPKKRLILFRSGLQQTETLRVVSGAHRLRVRVRSTAENYEQSQSVSGSFAKDGERTLHIEFDKSTRQMRLTLQ